jgi:hypothetical protein
MSADAGLLEHDGVAADAEVRVAADVGLQVVARRADDELAFDRDQVADGTIGRDRAAADPPQQRGADLADDEEVLRVVVRRARDLQPVVERVVDQEVGLHEAEVAVEHQAIAVAVGGAELAPPDQQRAAAERLERRHVRIALHLRDPRGEQEPRVQERIEHQRQRRVGDERRRDLHVQAGVGPGDRQRQALAVGVDGDRVRVVDVAVFAGEAHPVLDRRGPQLGRIREVERDRAAVRQRAEHERVLEPFEPGLHALGQAAALGAHDAVLDARGARHQRQRFAADLHRRQLEAQREVPRRVAAEERHERGAGAVEARLPVGAAGPQRATGFGLVEQHARLPLVGEAVAGRQRPRGEVGFGVLGVVDRRDRRLLGGRSERRLLRRQGGEQDGKGPEQRCAHGGS